MNSVARRCGRLLLILFQFRRGLSSRRNADRDAHGDTCSSTITQSTSQAIVVGIPSPAELGPPPSIIGKGVTGVHLTWRVLLGRNS